MRLNNMERQHPILYSFRRCPYAMRARMALVNANIPFVLREIDLKKKHPELLSASSKGTVPVLILNDGTIIDESIDIVDYVFAINQGHDQPGIALIDQLNHSITAAIHRFKYHERYEADEVLSAREAIKHYLNQLEAYQANQATKSAHDWSKTDMIILPFVRQIYRSDPEYFEQLPYKGVKKWLHNIIDSENFLIVMTRTPVWEADQAPILLG
jgi:glutathione S-transferase